jgi:CPA1 family monovalent cation:H+ antiporter
VNVPELAANWRPILAAVAAVVAARVVVVYGLTWITNHWSEKVPAAWQHVLAWGGLRGAVSLALVLSLPAALGAERDELRVMAFGVVLFTLLVQATTMRPLVRWLGIATRSQGQDEYDLRHARLTALRAADARLDRLHNDGMISTPAWEKLKPVVTQSAAHEAVAVRHVLETQPELEAEALNTGWREMLRAQRAALLDLRQDSLIPEEVFDKLAAEVDAQLVEGFSSQAEDDERHTQFIEVALGPHAAAAQHSVAELALPNTAVLVSIRRGKKLLIPRGDTRFQAGDVVTALCEREQAEAIRRLLLGGPAPGPESAML